MNRRRLIISGAGLFSTFYVSHPAFAQISTPVPATSLPDLPSDISPIALSDELELLYFRSVTLGVHVQLVGELRNTTDYWVPAPLLILNSESGLRAQPAMLHGDIPPGGREQFSHGFFDELVGSERADALKISIDTVDHEFCDIEPVDVYNDQMQLQVASEEVTIDLDRPAFQTKVKVKNLGDMPTHYVYASALFFDEKRYYCGALTTLDNARLSSGESFEFELEEGFNTYSTAGNPLELINRDPTVVVQAGWFQPGSLICI